MVKHSYKEFLKLILPLAIPIMIQNFLSSSLGMLDGIMISHYGNQLQSTINMAAVSQANRVFFVVMLFYFGISAGASIFFSQFYGKKDYAGLRRILGVALFFGLCLSLIPFFGSIFFSKELMSIFVSDNDTEVIVLGASFLKIIGWSYPVYICSWVYGFALRSIGNPRIVMFSSIAALVLNSILNYFLIFGFGSIPAYGIVGAAFGTVVSRYIEFFILLVFIYTRKESPLKAHIKDIFSFSFIDIKNYFKTSLPVILEEGLWGAGITVSFAIYGSMGRTTLAASGIAGPFIDISFVSFFAIAQATSITMGKLIGEKRSNEELHYVARQCMWLGFYSSLIVIFFLSFVPYLIIPIFYPISKDAIHLAILSLWAFEALLLIRGAQMVGLIGILRGSGDTLYGMIVDLTGVWLIMVPIVYYTGVVLHWSLPMVQLSSFIFDAVVFIFVIARIRTDKWIKDITYEVPKIA